MSALPLSHWHFVVLLVTGRPSRYLGAQDEVPVGDVEAKGSGRSGVQPVSSMGQG